jgi:hypothetical protein
MRSDAATLRPKPNQAPAPIDALALRAWARTYLWAAGEIKNIPNAIDPLQTFALDSGLVDEIGQDAVQKILAGPFVPYRCETPGDDDAVCRDDEARRKQAPVAARKSKERSTPRTTIEAIMWSIRKPCMSQRTSNG